MRDAAAAAAAAAAAVAAAAAAAAAACDHLAAAGHGNTVCSILTQPTDPQIITGSHDSQIKLWDLVAGKCYSTLTHHKKSVRGMALHPTKYP